MGSVNNLAKSLKPRKWRGWLLVCLLAAGLAASPWAWRQTKLFFHMRTARSAFARFVADNAVIELRAAEQLAPQSAEIQYLLGVAYRKAGRIDNVRSHLENAARLGWPKKEVRFQLTLLAFQAGDRDAEAELQQMFHRNLDDAAAEQIYESLALGYLAEYRVSDADLVLKYWCDWRPECIRPRLLRAEIFEIIGQSARQREQYEKILSVDPQNYSAHLGLAYVLMGNHDTEKALVHYRFCHEQWATDPVASLGIAACLQHEGKLAEAKQILDEMLRQRLPPSERASALAHAAEIAQQQRDLPLAIKLLSEAVEIDVHNSRLHYMLGVCLAKTGQQEDGKRYSQRSAEIDKLQQRRSDLELELLTHPDDADLRFEIGDVLRKLGHTKPAAAMMLSVLRWDPGHQGAHAALAEYYEDIGRDDLVQKHRLALGNESEASSAPFAAEGQISHPTVAPFVHPGT
ncbi:MAG TPA: tetratricopeptide repeat protein [Pirellulales bacterium]|nr:tetratricopeptide repeat protein [Pirellulales bacterium]